MQISLALPDIDLQLSLSNLYVAVMLAFCSLYPFFDIFAALAPLLRARPTARVMANSLFISGLLWLVVEKSIRARPAGDVRHRGFRPLITLMSITPAPG